MWGIKLDEVIAPQLGKSGIWLKVHSMVSDTGGHWLEREKDRPFPVKFITKEILGQAQPFMKTYV